MQLFDDYRTVDKGLMSTRMSYCAEKAAALKRLATLIDAIVHERTASVLLLNRKRN